MKTTNPSGQRFQPGKLSSMLNPNDEFCILSQKIPWNELNRKFGQLFSKAEQPSGISVRLIIGLLVIGELYQISDEEVIARWLEYPYWQYFCGCDHLEWSIAVEPSWLPKWRQALGEEGMKDVFAIESQFLEKRV